MLHAYAFLGYEVDVDLLKADGETVQPGESIARVEGSIRALLTAERTALNILQHMSGIATATKQAIDALGNPGIGVCDTRKTLPGMRMLQKYAVRCGGGKNHRFRLDDGVMIKDNHISGAGSITAAVEKVRLNVGHMVKIEVETKNKEEVLEAVAAGADVIMFDNATPGQVKEWRTLVPKHIITEISGGITPENIAGYADSGADVISLGWLTHSAQALDISFNLID